MTFQVGDKVVWTLFPDYGEGVVVEVIEDWGLGVRFANYDLYLSDDDRHNIFTDRTVKVPDWSNPS